MEKTEWVTHYHCEIGCVNSMFRSLSWKVLFVVKSLDKCNAAQAILRLPNPPNPLLP